MKQYQTPYKFYARSAEYRNRKSKDFPKITKKCLNAAFASVSGDSSNSSPISEILHDNRKEDVPPLLLEEDFPENLLPSYTMPSGKITKEAGGIGSSICLDAHELDSSMFTSVEAEIAAKSVRNVQPEVLNPHNVAPQYKKLMDELTKYITEDHYNTLPEDFDQSAQVISLKNRMLFTCFCVWIVGVLAILFFASDIHCPSSVDHFQPQPFHHG